MPKVFESEEDLLDHLQTEDLAGLDSEFSATSRNLVLRLGAKGMDLTRWWILTPSYWVCPVCKRSKPEIVRLNQHGYLTGHLHRHHDHMADFVREEFTRASEARDTPVADATAEKFVIRTAFALSAYDKTIICSDCNAADPKAKKIVAAPVRFSFSPAEIARFIVATPNEEHRINSDAVHQVWEECRPMFDVRVKLVRMIAELGASNSHWYQPSERTAKQVESAAYHLIKYYGLDTLAQNRNPEQLLYRPSKFSGSKDSWRRRQVKRKPASKSPTDGELQHLINISEGRWQRTPDDWSCPICGRSKIECVRKSNAGKWGFVLATDKIFYNPDQSQQYKQYLKVCNDCSNTATSIAKEAEERAGIRLEWSSSLVLPEEVQRVVSAVPHGKHRIDNDAVEVLLSKIEERISCGLFSRI